ncbi:restriction endonuclease subunit S [Brachyspira pilosicoli]|uniref:restriction endonuclease subunit S n=1 Tax=Brachyspira pilosicoli TaxID=52584 RepID=UPI000C781239|nr:restriction endonuclease subunit S [Brachyspira pilosicoli]PLV56508.1 restriction endonuclease subunit S [Brachyspira pilosicoli SP16]
MTASELKKSILQMAVEGKLTEQSEKDEPIEELLKRIKEEKESLIKEGKIKKEKTISEIYKKDGSYYERVSDGKNILKDACIDEELPFEIPDTWTWVRLGNLILLTSGQDLSNNKYNSLEKGIPYITGASSIENEEVIINRWTEYPTTIAYKNSLLLTCKGTVGTMAFLNCEKAHIARQIMAIFPLFKMNLNYIKIFLESFVNILKSSAKSMIPGITRDNVLSILFPLPPIEEQKHIVEKINLLMPLINEYDELEKSITKLNKEFPDNIKKSILQYAIEGKLTEQSQEDEPVEELLKRIKEEREKLIKEGKIKKDKTTSEIYKKDGSYYERVFEGDNIVKDVCIDDELPFEIPDSWCWCNVSDIANIYTGNSINENEKKTKYMGVTSGYCYIATKDVGFDNIINYDNGVKIPNTDNKFRIAPKNSVLLCIEGGSAGKKISVTDKDVCFGNKLCCFSTIRVNVFFLYYYLQSPVFNLIFKENINGIIGGVSINKLKQLKIPLPPIEEQGRIVDKINRVNEVINTIKI